jgi:hypothetical protein
VTVIKVKIDISDAINLLTAAQKQVDYATAAALTKTAQAVKAAEREEMQRVFTSAVPFTLNSLYVKSATRSNLVATVGVKDQGGTSAADWLLPEIEGGRRPRGIEVFLKPIGLPPTGMYAVPGSAAPMSGNKKININALKKIVGQLRSQPQGAAGFTSIKRASTKTGRSSRKAQYFFLDKPMFGLPAGIFGVKGRAIQPIILFVKQPSYRRKFDFYGVATTTAERVFPQAFKAALAAALATAR